MSIKVRGNEIGQDLCNMLGINPSDVRDIVIRCHSNQAVQLEVTTYLTEEQRGPLLKALAKLKCDVNLNGGGISESTGG